MANLAQTVNNLHSLFLADGPQFTVTPTYYVFDLFQAHQGARLVETIMETDGASSPNLTVSASRKEGKTLVTIGNLSCTQDTEVILETVGKGCQILDLEGCCGLRTFMLTIRLSSLAK